jgi:hypothetical protein
MTEKTPASAFLENVEAIPIITKSYNVKNFPKDISVGSSGIKNIWRKKWFTNSAVNRIY